MKIFNSLLIYLIIFFVSSCEEKISQKDLDQYKDVMDIRLGHLGNAIIIQGRLLDAFNLRNDRADEDHFKEAEELVKGNLELFGRPDELKSLKIPNSGKLRKIHNSLIEASELPGAFEMSLQTPSSIYSTLPSSSGSVKFGGSPTKF